MLGCHCHHHLPPAVGSVPVLAGALPCFVLLLHGTRCRGVICSLRLKAFQYFPDMSLVPSRFHAMIRFSILPLFSSSGSSPITCFLISYFFDIILMRSSTADRSPPAVMSSPCMVATMSLPLDASSPHAWACDPSCQLEITEC